jgi:hypothetical protein
MEKRIQLALNFQNTFHVSGNVFLLINSSFFGFVLFIYQIQDCFLSNILLQKFSNLQKSWKNIVINNYIPISYI